MTRYNNPMPPGPAKAIRNTTGSIKMKSGTTAQVIIVTYFKNSSQPLDSSFHLQHSTPSRVKR